MARSLTPEQLEEFKKCCDDWVYTVETYGWLRHTSRGAIRWKPYPYQVEMLRAMQRGENVITIKSRQIGCSWTAGAGAALLMIFNPDTDILILSAKEVLAIDLLKKIKFFFNRLPRFLKPKIVVNSRVQFSVEFRAKRGDDVYISESTIHSLTTTTNTGRGFSARLVIMDEAASLPNAEETWTAVLPTTTHGGQVAVVSTPSGVNNFYHRLWIKTELGDETGFTPIRAYYKDCGFDEEWLRKVTVGLTAQQILQEYELTFLAGGNPFFDLTQLALCYYPKSEYPEIEDAQGHDIKTKTYMNFTGVDTSTGTRKGNVSPDYTSIVTLNEYGVEIDSYHNNRAKLEETAGYTMHLEGGERVEVEGRVSQWHREYRGMCVIEKNGSGSTVLSRHVTPDDGRSLAIGRMTTAGIKGSGSKIRLLNALKLAFAGRQIIITDPFTDVCLQAMEDKGQDKAEAADGMFDDPVIALMLAYSELKRWGGFQINFPEQTSDGRRMISVTSAGDLPPDKLADVLSVGETMVGPLIESGRDVSPGTGRLTDEVDDREARVRPPRVRQPT